MTVWRSSCSSKNRVVGLMLVRPNVCQGVRGGNDSLRLGRRCMSMDSQLMDMDIVCQYVLFGDAYLRDF
jgi:hypothetical protein